MTFDVVKCMERTPEEIVKSANTEALKFYSIADLVRELCSREGVEYTELGKTTLMRGPAKIIVIRGDE